MSRTIIFAATFVALLIGREADAAFALGGAALYFTSSPTSFVGGGLTELLTPANGHHFSGFRRFNEFDDSNEVHLSVTDGDESWSIDLGGPNTTLVSVGSYPDAVRWPFNGSQPGLSFSGHARGDGTLSGSFQILDLVLSGTGTLDSIAVDFIQYDSKLKTQWNFGSWRLNSSIPLTPVPEPSTIALEILALGALPTRRRKATSQNRV